MTTQAPPIVHHFRWSQVLFLAAVIVVSDIGMVWWFGSDTTATSASASVPGADVFDEEMSRAVRRTALEAGLNPASLPELSALWTAMAQRRPEAAAIDLEDRDAVQGALERHVTAMGSAQRGGGRGGRGGQGGAGGRQAGAGSEGGMGGGPAGMERGASGMAGDKAEEASEDAAGTGSLRLTPSIERIDEMQALRLGKLANSKGIDPASVLPSDAMRQAALSSGDASSEEAQALMEAYRQAFSELQGGAQ
jgi:hypothetical protein